ncbi:hypothetical protein [Lactococcus petauri]|uniref:hypothetical protein n=1 Tax=Lactococcus petauri TaxID=1940789 RepID=UPI001F58A59B|nr:hypothetical protein [Lactococcus petauri]
MLKTAYSLLLFSAICVLLVFLTFFINFKYDPGFAMKLSLICAFLFLGIRSWLWIKQIKKDEKQNNILEKRHD